MYQRVTVLRESGDKLNAKEYIFRVKEQPSKLLVFLCEYVELSRPTTRHHYRIQARWGGFDRRDNAIKEQPHVPEGIREEAVQKVKDSIEYREE